ncbi:hypothetical protein BFN03_18555 [Rhodococcus sp. WMMA185]|uniref:DUF4352 domain-containing protein n=1 Tax=Rhodococcus sp. WMMA185 TaxID=679318 RepID=UPI000878CFE1|nr:DUF4352 domain-containing protein [Rhodococcus sp. WMMA185]AOW93990.1 hypothetical protein BFN03_18555 [Rhodococcus sp. WMMA185]
MTSPNPDSPQRHSSYGYEYGESPEPERDSRKGLYATLGLTAVFAILLYLFVIEDFSFFGNRTQVTQDGAPAPSDVEFIGKQADDTGVPIGATVTRGGVAITAGPLENRTADYADSELFLCTRVTLVNGSDKSARVPSSHNFHLQDPEGFSRTSSFVSGAEELEFGEIAAGGSPTSGLVCFEDPGQFGEYVVLGEGLFDFLDTSRIGWVAER